MKLKLINKLFLLLFFIFSCDYVDISGIIIGSKSNISERFDDKDSLFCNTPPEIKDTNNFNFAVITDTHYDKSNLGYIQDLNNKKNEFNISFIIITGDMVQSGLDSQYQLIKQDISNSSTPVYTTIGNHDLYNNGYENYKKYFGRTIYDFKIGDNHLIFLDTANGTLGEKQKNWLSNLLENSKTKNKFIFSHYSLTDNELQSVTATSYQEETYYLFDLFEKYKVTYFICGHLHNYSEKEIKGVKYLIINNREKNNNSILLISIKNNNPDYKFY